MKLPHLFRHAAILGFTTAILHHGSVNAGELRAGAAWVNITPKTGAPMGGYYKFRAVEGVRDPLYAKTIVLEKDGTLAALVVLDHVRTARPMMEAAKKLIQEQCGIAPDHVMISATHTHTGPDLPRGTMMDDITKATSPPGMEYANSLAGLIVKSINEAKSKLAAARPAVAMGLAEGISFNRRVLRDGSSQAIWQPAKIDPAKEHPAGPVDPQVGLLVFNSTTPQAPPLAAYVNFAMHPTSVGGGVRVSADYPGVFTKVLNERHGGNMPVVFANGCCGNINSGDYISGKRRSTEELGTALADAATAAWSNLVEVPTRELRARSVTLNLPRRQFTEADIAKAKDIASRMMTENLGTVPMAEAVCILETQDKKEKNVPLLVDVQVISFSDDVAVLALPGEIFVEYGLAIKKASPFKHTFIAELANGSIGYVPTREAFPQGNYEVVSARGDIGTGETLVETALKLLNEVKAGN